MQYKQDYTKFVDFYQEKIFYVLLVFSSNSDNSNVYKLKLSQYMKSNSANSLSNSIKLVGKSHM